MEGEEGGGVPQATPEKLARWRQAEPLYVPYLEEYAPSPYFWLIHAAARGDVTQHERIRWLPVLLVCYYADKAVGDAAARAKAASAGLGGLFG